MIIHQDLDFRMVNCLHEDEAERLSVTGRLDSALNEAMTMIFAEARTRLN